VALSAKVGAFNSSTAAAGNTVAVTGVGFTPKALILWWSGRTETTDAVGGFSHQRGWGFVASTTQRCCTTSQSQDAQTSAVTDRHHRADACVSTLTTAGAQDGLLDLQSFDADGFTLIIDDAFAASIRIHYLALGGDDLTNAHVGSVETEADAGAQAITGVGFQPDCVFFLSNHDTGTTINVDTRMLFGAAVSPTELGVWAGGSNDAAATMQTVSYCNDAELMAMMTASTNDINDRASFTGMDSDGFTINWDENSGQLRWFYWLALKGGQYKIGSLTTQTDTTTDIVETGFGFQPVGALFVSHCQAESTIDALQDHDAWSMGAFSSTSNRGAQGTLDQDNTADSTVAAAVEHDAVYVNISTADAVEGLMDIKSVDSDGFTCIMDDADPSAAFVWYVAFGSEPVVSAPTTVAGWPAFVVAPSIGGEYQIFLKRDTGERIALLDPDTLSFAYTNVVNGLGPFSLHLPASFDRDLIARNRRVEFWRKPPGGSFRRDYVGLITRHFRSQARGGNIVREIGGSSLNVLLKRRIVAYAAGGVHLPYSKKTDQIDDMMKAIVRENLGSLANTTRQLSSSLFSVEADAGLGPSITRQFSMDNVFTLLNSLSANARAEGTEIYFEIVPTTETQFEFRTYVGQPGQDRTASSGISPLVFSFERENVSEMSLDEDWEDEINVFQVGGQGEADRRTLLTVNTYSAIQDALARAEGFYDGRNISPDATALQDAGHAELLQHRALKRLTAKIVNAPGALYQKDWWFGDRVTLSFDGLQVDALIRSVSVARDGNFRESIDSTLEGFFTDQADQIQA
jgi:hypothetical protein